MFVLNLCLEIWGYASATPERLNLCFDMQNGVDGTGRISALRGGRGKPMKLRPRRRTVAKVNRATTFSEPVYNFLRIQTQLSTFVNSK